MPSAPGSPPTGHPTGGSGTPLARQQPESPATESTGGILAAVEANLAASRRLGAQRLELAYAWAVAHEVPFDASPRTGYRELGATGLRIGEYAAAELAVALHTTPLAAQRLIGDAIDLVHRLPATWAAVRAGTLEAWVARKITALTRELADRAAGDARAARQARAHGLHLGRATEHGTHTPQPLDTGPPRSRPPRSRPPRSRSPLEKRLTALLHAA